MEIHLAVRGGLLYNTYSAAQKKPLQATGHLLFLERKVLCQQGIYLKRISPDIQMFPMLHLTPYF